MTASRTRTGPRTCLTAFFLASLLALPAAATHAATGSANMEPSTDKSSIFRRDTGIDDSGSYQQEVQACLSGRTQQARETCLLEARNAHAALRRGELTRQDGDFTANALARCEPLMGEYKAACHARVMGFGTASGSVSGGGMLREVETVVLPDGAASVTFEPQTSDPVVLAPSDLK